MYIVKKAGIFLVSLFAVLSSISLAGAQPQKGQSTERGVSERIQQRDNDRLRSAEHDRILQQERLQQRAQEQQSRRIQDRLGEGPQDRIYGEQLMTEQEREQYRQQLRTLSTEQEREAFRAAHREQIETRAKAQGVSIDAEQ